MKSRLLYLIFLITSISLSQATYAQRKCGTVEYMNHLNNVESKEAFEQWLNEKKAHLSNTGLKGQQRTEETTIYQIPVVVHVIHNGEAEENGSNISESQILSQIEVLNEDFKKLNTDSVNIPDQFKSLYANIGFEFVLAKRDPDNNPTNGITRTQGSKTTWFMTNDATLKSQSYWPSVDYLNIWVAPLGGGFLGWAQYPESTLDGVLPPYDVETDGVVITYDAFGSIDKDPTANLQSNYNLGRTATHEIGHFFGLRHIWGDGGCGVDDYVNDTPIAEDSYGGCPSLGPASTSCGSQDMFMNYMDYVNDDCMNLFTEGQKERMIVVVENSPRRLSLTTSLALFPPNCEDIALLSFTAPEEGICLSTVYPSLEIQNTGPCIIDSVKLNLEVNGVLIASKLFDLKLASGETQEIYFDATDLTNYGNIEFTAEVVSVNGVEDGYPDNNIVSKKSLRPEPVAELDEDFSSENSQWSLKTSQEISRWDIETAIFYSTTNTSGVFDYYEAPSGSDAYVSPKLLINGDKTLLFDLAYGYRDGFDDTFMVLASTNCGLTFPDTLFNASGLDLATSSTPVKFYPSGAIDWKHYQIDLSSYVNQEIIIAFTGISSGGNSIYLDNIKVVDNTYNDIALAGLPYPALACNDATLVYIENKGRSFINSLNLEVNQGLTTTTITYSQLDLQPGDLKEVTLPIYNFNNTTLASISIADQDDNQSNNTLTQTLINPIGQIEMPLREQFNNNSSLPEGWYLTGKDTDTNLGWRISNNKLEWIASDSRTKGSKELITLPPLNMENLLTSSLHFDRAYAFDGLHEELFRVKVSVDCGQTYDILYEEGGENLATVFSTLTTWAPSEESDWLDTYVDLSDYTGYENVQVVLELTSAQGNNIYIDTIELYASNIINPITLEENTLSVYPNPITSDNIQLTINLSKAQPAHLSIINSQGSIVYSYDVPNALNQTFDIPVHGLQNGIYFARFMSNEQSITQSFILSK